MKKIIYVFIANVLIILSTGCPRNETTDNIDLNHAEGELEQQYDKQEKEDIAQAVGGAIERIDEIGNKDVALALKLSKAAEEILGKDERLTAQREKIEKSITELSQKQLTSTNSKVEIPLLPLLYKNTKELGELSMAQKLPDRFIGMCLAENKITELVRQKNAEHALELSFSAEQLFGSDIMLWAQRSDIYDLQNKHIEAIAEIKKAANYEANFYNRMIRLYVKWGEKTNAIQTLGEALNDPRAKDNMQLISKWGLEQAQLYYETGDLKKARNRSEETLEILSNKKENNALESYAIEERRSKLEKLIHEIKDKNPLRDGFRPDKG